MMNVSCEKTYKKKKGLHSQKSEEMNRRGRLEGNEDENVRTNMLFVAMTKERTFFFMNHFWVEEA